MGVSGHDHTAIVIGGGTMGCTVAAHLARGGGSVLLVERRSELCAVASLINQARIHNGYHYPRSVLTGVRSRVNFPRFLAAYPDAVVDEFDQHYAIARVGSKVSSAQFRAYCGRIGSPVERASADVRSLFDRRMIDDVFRVREAAFDAHRLRDELHERLLEHGVEVEMETRADRIGPLDSGIRVELEDAAGTLRAVSAERVINCTYAAMNGLLEASGLPIIPLRHELTEMALVRVPGDVERLGITVMDGAFFSVMPYPTRGLHSLSHVRYTPHGSWTEADRYVPPPVGPRPRSNFEFMRRDAQRLLPCAAGFDHVDSIWTIKTVLPTSEVDDSRPILMRHDHGGVRGLTCIVGGKIDNIFDALDELDRLGAMMPS